MAAKTDQEKAAEAAQKEKVAEAEAQDKQNEKDAEEINARLGAASAADAQTESDNALREQIREELRQEVLNEQREKAGESNFAGQLHHSEHFIVNTNAANAAESISVRPVGWVGEAPLTIARDKLDDLLAALGKVNK